MKENMVMKKKDFYTTISMQYDFIKLQQTIQTIHEEQYPARFAIQ